MSGMIRTVAVQARAGNRRRIPTEWTNLMSSRVSQAARGGYPYLKYRMDRTVNKSSFVNIPSCTEDGPEVCSVQ